MVAHFEPFPIFQLTIDDGVETRSKLCRDLSELSDLTVDDLVQLYRQEMTDLVDQHCPVVEARRKAKQMTPWFNAECRDASRHARAAERHYRLRVLTWTSVHGWTN